MLLPLPNLYTRIQHMLDRQTEKIREYIVTSAQNVIDTVTGELTDLQGPLGIVLTEVNALVAAGSATTVNTDQLAAAAQAVVTGFNAIATAAAPAAPPVVTPPSA
jgi:hypothetical protein